MVTEGRWIAYYELFIVTIRHFLKVVTSMNWFSPHLGRDTRYVLASGLPPLPLLLPRAHGPKNSRGAEIFFGGGGRGEVVGESDAAHAAISILYFFSSAEKVFQCRKFVFSQFFAFLDMICDSLKLIASNFLKGSHFPSELKSQSLNVC